MIAETKSEVSRLRMESPQGVGTTGYDLRRVQQLVIRVGSVGKKEVTLTIGPDAESSAIEVLDTRDGKVEEYKPLSGAVVKVRDGFLNTLQGDLKDFTWES